MAFGNHQLGQFFDRSVFMKGDDIGSGNHGMAAFFIPQAQNIVQQKLLMFAELVFPVGIGFFNEVFDSFPDGFVLFAGEDVFDIACKGMGVLSRFSHV